MKVRAVIITIIIALSFSISIVEAIAPGWSEPILVREESGTSSTLLQDTNGTFWAAWRTNIEGPYGDIWISNSTDGLNWSVPVMITDNDTSDDMPSLIQDSNGTYWLAFKNSTAGGDQNIWIQNSSDGINWNVPIPVVTDAFKDYWPSLMQDSNGTFWVVWESQDRGANNDIYYAISDDGVNWSEPVNILTNATYWDYVPDIAQDSNGTYWLTWTCGYGSNDNLCISNSTDGSTWSTPNEIIIGGEWRPDLLHSNEIYWLVWGKASPDDNLYYSTSIDGIDWSAKVKVTTNASGDRNPSIINDSNSTIWIAWGSDRIVWEVWLTHSTVTLTSPLGGEVWNGTRNITWVSVSGDYQNDTFSLYYSTDGESWTLINSSITADGPYTNKSYEWNTSNVSDSGNYTIKIVRVHPLHNESDVSGIFAINNVDTEPPEVTGIVPADGAYVGGVQYINATVVDVLSGVGSVVANVSNATWSSVYVLSSGSGNIWYNDSWDTAQQAEGIYNVSINATDTLGYSNDTEYVTVTVDNTPPAYTWFSAPTSGTTGDSVLVNISASDNTGVSTANITVDGTEFRMAQDGTYWTYTINIPSDSTASILYNITIYDTASPANTNTTPDMTVIVTAPPPSGSGGGAARPKVILLANSIDYSLSSNFTAVLKAHGIDIIYTTPGNFSDYNASKFIVILGGPDAYDGVGEIVQEVLNESEQDWLREKGNRKMHARTNVWKRGQVVIVIAGSDREQTQKIGEEKKLEVRKRIKGY